MRFYLLSTILLALLTGCGQSTQLDAKQTGNNPKHSAAARTQPAKAAAPATGLPTWLKRYETAWQSAIDVTNEPKERSLVNVQLHIPTKEEQALLRELGSWGIADRVKLLQQILIESKTRQDLPIEYACHAATQGDETIRTRIWTELFQPQLAKGELSATENDVLLRGVMSLELASRSPGLTTKVVEYLLANAPPAIIDPNLNRNPSDPAANREMLPQLAFSLQLMTVACQAPVEEQDAISLKLTGRAFSAPPLAVATSFNGVPVEPQKLAFADSMMQAIERRIRQDGPKGPVKTTEEQLALLRDPGAPLSIVKQFLLSPGFKVEQLTTEEQRRIVARLAKAAKDQPGRELGSAINLVCKLDLSCDRADRRMMLLAVVPTGPDYYHLASQASELLAKAPAAEFVELFTDIVQENPIMLYHMGPATFDSLDAVQAKDLIRRLSPKVLAKQRSVLQSYAWLSNRLELGDRQKVHQFLLTQMAAISQEPKAPKQPFGQQLDPLGEYARVIALSNDLAPQTISDILALTYDGPGLDGKLVSAINKFGPHALSGLLAQMTPEQRAPWIKRIIAELQIERHSFQGQQVLFAICKVANKLTPAEAKELSPPIVACVAYEFQAESSQSSPRKSVGDYILARPKEERVELLKLLATNIFQARFKTNTYPQESSNGFELVNRVMRDIPAAEITPLALCSLDLRMKGTNYDGVTGHFLSKIYQQVPKDERPKLGNWINQQLAGQLTTYQLFQLASAHKQLPVALELAGQQRMFDLIIERTAAALNADPPKEAEPLSEGHSISFAHSVSEYLPTLLSTLPEAKTRPGLESLIDPLTKFAGDNFAKKGFRGKPDNFENFLPALGATPYPFSPEKTKRLTAAFFTYALDAHPVGLERKQDSAMSIRGTLPPGETKRLCNQIAEWHAEKRKYRDENLSMVIRYLKFLAGHVPAEEVPEFLTAVDAIIPLNFKPDPMAFRSPANFDSAAAHVEILRKLSDDITLALAEQRITQCADLAKTAEPPVAAQCKRVILQLLAPVARENPARFFELVATQQLDDSQQWQAYGFLAKCKDQALMSKLILERLKSIGELKASNNNLKGIVGITRSAPASLRLQILDELAKPGNDPFLLTMVFLTGRPPEEPSAIATLLREPENVALRRTFVIPSPRGGNPVFISQWQMMQE